MKNGDLNLRFLCVNFGSAKTSSLWPDAARWELVAEKWKADLF